MALRAPNIASGGGRNLSAQFKDLRAKLNSLRMDIPHMQERVVKVLGEAANEIRQDEIAAAMLANWPRELFPGAFFVAANPAKNPAMRALVGISKGKRDPRRAEYKEWTAARNPPAHPLKQVIRKVQHPGKVGMGLATMFEFGTTTMAPRPAIRQALSSARPKARLVVINGISQIIRGVANGTVNS